MSGNMRLSKWTKLYYNPKYKLPSPKQMERNKERDKKLIDDLIKLGETDLDYIKEWGELPLVEDDG